MEVIAQLGFFFQSFNKKRVQLHDVASSVNKQSGLHATASKPTPSPKVGIAISVLKSGRSIANAPVLKTSAAELSL